MKCIKPENLILWMWLSILFQEASSSSRPVPPKPPKPEKFFSSPDPKLHSKLFTESIDTIMENCVSFNRESERIKGPYLAMEPEQLKRYFPIELGTPINDTELVYLLKKICQLSPKAGHPYMLTKRQGSLDLYSLAGDWMAATMSNLVVTYQVAPIWTLMEIQMTEYLREQFGWKEADAVSTSGAGSANSIAVSLGIAHSTPHYKTNGTWSSDKSKQLGIFVSEHASPSWEKAAIYQGVGLKNLIRVKPNKQGIMTLQALKVSLRENRHLIPVLVGVTIGTPILGAVDEIDKIGKYCNENKIWFHIDAERGGGQIITQKAPGIGMANSVTFGGWVWGTPYVSTMLLTQDAKVLNHELGFHASYVFTELDLYNGNWDRGDHTIQTSRRPEISKLWFLFRKHGIKFLRAQIEKTNANKQYILDLMQQDPEFVLILDPNDYQLPLISFFYASNERLSHPNYITKISIGIRDKLRKDYKMELSLSKVPNWDYRYSNATFLTISLTNGDLTCEDVEYIFKTIQAAGRAVTGSKKPSKYVPVPPTNDEGTENNSAFLKSILKDIFLKNGIFFPRESDVANFKQPEVLLNISNFLTLNNEDGVSKEQIKEDFKQIIEFSPHWAHPYFIYQLAAGLDPYSLVADWVATATNAPMLSYDDSPLFQLMEIEVAKELRKIVFKTEDGDGVITDGGSMANQMALALARHWKNKEMKEGGYTVSKNKLVGFISAAAHYSTIKGAIVQGLGQDNIILVEADKLGQMDMNDLDIKVHREKDKGNIPFFLLITTGTTILASVDPIEKSVEACRKFQLWCHVDGMFGGLSVMSPKYRNGLMKGLEGTDSWGADLHKLFGSTMVSTILITKHPDIISDTFSVGNVQDFAHETKAFGVPRGDRHWQYDKRNNILKFWLLWKAKGSDGMAKHIDTIMTNKDYIIKRLHDDDRKAQGFFSLLKTYDLTNVCFYYVPKILHPFLKGHENNETIVGWISRGSFAIERDLLLNRLISIVSQDLHDAVPGYTGVFLKAVMMGSSIGKADIDYILDAIVYSGETAGTEAIKLAMKVPPEAESESGREIRIYSDRFDPFGHLPYSIIEGYKEYKPVYM